MATVTSHPHNLPLQSSSFIGREQELAGVSEQVHTHRLVTLTGTGGVGKTRLALQVAAGEIKRFRDGVWVVELAALAAPELVVDAVAKAMSCPDPGEMPPLDALSAFVRSKHLLLVLDNCEHLRAEASRVAGHLLGSCPNMRILATSREPLAVADELVVAVPPLSVPDDERISDEQAAMTYDAVRLFIERARASEPSLRITEANLPAIAEICHHLDGLPLALELAAGRVRGMGLTHLSARLDDRFKLLADRERAGKPSQQTLRAMIAWSDELLAPPERVVLRRLGVFAGSFSLDAAEVICAGDYDANGAPTTIAAVDVLDHIDQLIRKSLVQFDQETSRYRLLESIRLYARERLRAAGETERTERQHSAWYLAMVEDGSSLVGGPGEGSWFKRLEEEYDNLRAALGWALRERRDEDAASLALGLWPFWRSGTRQREGYHWLEQVLARDSEHPLHAELRPRLFNALGVLAHTVRHFERARAFHEQALQLWREADDKPGIAQGLLDLGWERFMEAAGEDAKTFADKSRAAAELSGDQRLIAGALYLNAAIHMQMLRADGAALTALAGDIERALRIWRDLGDINSVASTLGVLAHHYMRNGDPERAKPLLAEAARLHVRMGTSRDMLGVVVGLSVLAGELAQQPPEARDAARLFGVLFALDEGTAVTPSPFMMIDHTRGLLDKITRLTGHEGYTQSIEEGRRLTSAGFLSLVDRITAPASPRATPRPMTHTITAYADLTPREVEVLRLVAQGLTNAQVAEKLVVTPRTVNAHLTAIYGKLGVTSRAGAIRYAMEQQLG